MDTPEAVYTLFDSLGYKVLDSHLKTSPSVYNLPLKEAALVEKIYAVANYDRRFQILLFKLKEDSKEAIRTIPEKILREVDYPFIIFTPDYKTYTFTLVEKVREGPGEFKRKLTKLIVDRFNTYYTDKDVISNFSLQAESTNPLEIFKTIQKAMSVERVTEKFFKEYKEVFFYLKSRFAKQVNDTRLGHDFTQQLMNRVMFLYFIAKKRWISDDIHFLKNFWTTYTKSKKLKNSFYSEWLSVLFFEAFNNKFFPKSYFSKELNSMLQLSPYLNGGLFTEQRLDSVGIIVLDDDFLKIYNFFNRYNFTIREDLPLEEEVAVDPEMIGKVYESLVNLSESSDERGDAGIFYTPRAEIDFMCRLSLVEYLDQHIAPTPSKDDIYKLVFAKSESESMEAIEHLKVSAGWPNFLEETLDNLSVVDPAVGSGSFLVGMLMVLSELYKLIYRDVGRNIDDFEIKKQIIGRSLYGIDVMEWAVHVCELRLWLQLVVEADIPLNERKTSPLLPNLTFKIRQGDSLVEEVGGVNLSMRNRSALNSVIKRKITILKQAKYDYFYNNRSSKYYQSEALLKQEEQLIFQMILDERIMQIRNEIIDLENIRKQETLSLPGMEVKKSTEQKDLFEESNKKLKETKASEIEFISELRKNIKTNKPFIWDIDFVEIFADENERGFDIVIGNPPYVRQEKISDPRLPKEKVTIENKKEYKEKLIQSVRARFPWMSTLNKKSDLYVYFFFHGLSLLNSLGTLCFITSNSWLDVGYGANLQDFLLEHVQVKAIFDNQAKRSFKSADVNTVITLLGSPDKHENTHSGNRVKFVMFKRSFDEVVNTSNLIRIDNALHILSDSNLRVFPATQYELMRDGWEYPDTTPESQKESYTFSVGKYAGNKWGGKFLRAPDIYFTCLARQNGHEVLLGSLFDGERYLNTGGADGFFILTDVKKIDDTYSEITNTSIEGKKNGYPKFRIENKYLKSLIKDVTKDNKRIEIKKPDAWVLNIEDSKPDIETTKYILWGEKVGFNKRSVTKNQKPWYKPTRQMQRSGKILFPRSFNESHIIFYNPREFIALRFYRLYPKEKISIIPILAILNTSYFGLLMELCAPGNLGLGALDVTMASFLRLKIPYNYSARTKLENAFQAIKDRKIVSVYEETGINPQKNIREQKPEPLPDRKILDDIVFSILDLTVEERNEVYWSLCELVRNRLEKAKSL